MAPSQFYKDLKKIDEAILAGPDEADFQRDIMPHMGSPTARRYFYQALKEDACWLPQLVSAGEFLNAPEPIENVERQTVTAAPWPQSKYLAVLGSGSSDRGDVLRVAMSLIGTKNPFIWDDLLDIAIAMPSDFGARIVPEALIWLASPYQQRIGSKIGTLMAQLAESGGVTARVDMYDYKEIVQKDLPVVVKAEGERTLGLLSSLLDRSLSLDRKQIEKPYDLSCIWRPAIEDHEQNWEHDIRTFLVTAIRDAAVEIMSGNRCPIQRVLDALESRQWTVFRRIGLYLLSRFPAMVPDLVSERLSDRSIFDDHALQHEYAVLAKAGFPFLEP